MLDKIKYLNQPANENAVLITDKIVSKTFEIIVNKLAIDPYI